MVSSMLIVGAGAAGLTAGYDLIRSGLYQNVTLLEASGIHGGRLRKLEGFADFAMDIGGEWLQTNPSVLQEIVNDPSVNVTVETFPHNVYVYAYALRQFVRRDSLGVDNYKFRNSTWYDFFNDYIYPTVSDHVVYNCPVYRIDYSNNKEGPVVVDSACGTFQADQVIVTASLNCLKDGDIEFIPQLPRDKLRALWMTMMPPGLKVFMEFSHRFYDQPGWYYSADVALNKVPDPNFYYDETYGQNSSKNILGLFSWNVYAERYVNLNDQEIVNRVLADLDSLFDGQATQYFIKARVQNWQNEPYVKGSYSDYGNAAYDRITTLRRPLDNRVFFAGEHIPHPNSGDANGFAHGAALSGREAAKEAMRG